MLRGVCVGTGVGTGVPTGVGAAVVGGALDGATVGVGVLIWIGEKLALADELALALGVAELEALGRTCTR